MRPRLPHLSSVTTSHNLGGLAAHRERLRYVDSPHQTHRAVQADDRRRRREVAPRRFGDTQETDPFLLLDDLRNDRPQDYLAGFPWHPHRGIETITYVLSGTVEHGDSLGNRGTLGAGDVHG